MVEASIRTIVVAGAGVAGLVSANLLQSRGFHVTLVDRNPLPGGKLNLVEDGGFRFDTGPSLLTMPDVFRRLFGELNMDFDDELRPVRLDPYCRYRFPDGIVFDTSDSLEQMSRTLLEHAPGDLDSFFSFLARAAAWYQMSVETVIEGPPLDWRRMRTMKLDPVRFFRMRPFESLDRYLARTFDDERIRRLCRLISLYTGCAPDRTPAIFTLIPFLEFGLGRWYIPGGLYRIAEVLHRRFESLGGKFLPDTEIRAIDFENGRAARAHTQRGDVLEADHFVVNADVGLAARTFLSSAPGAPSLTRRLSRLRPSTSAFVLLIGTSAPVGELVHHNILFSDDEAAEWKSIFRNHVPAGDPTIYLNNPSYTDPNLAPAGKSALFAMVNVPPDDPGKWSWEKNRESYRETVLRTIERRAVPGLRDRIEVLHERTPLDFRERTWADRGSLYGLAPDSMFAMMRRPVNREKGFEGVTFAGGTTHPGAGIPLAALSGRLAADLITIPSEPATR